MITKRNGILSLGTVFFFALICAESVHAGLLANVVLDQQLYEDDMFSGSSKTVTDTVVPFQGSATVTDQFGGSYGGSITGNYSITDNGSVAVFEINCSGHLTTNGNSVTESTVNGANALFYLTQPCLYTETYSCTGPSNSMLTYQDTRQPQINGSITNSTRTYSGTVGAGFFGINEGWVLSNNGVIPSNQTGSDSISITFYATQPIPEPSSAMLIGLPALALLARRPRPARRRIACRGTRKRWMSPSHLAEKE